MREYIKISDPQYISLTTEDLFQVLSKRTHSFFLDSSMEADTLGEYSFLGAEPTEILTFEKGEAAPYEKLRKTLELEDGLEESSEEASTPFRKKPFPFVGGYVGYLSYDLGRYSEKIPELAKEDVFIPYYWFGKYPFVFAVNHKTSEKWMILNGSTPEERMAGKHYLEDILGEALDWKGKEKGNGAGHDAIKPYVGAHGVLNDAVAQGVTSVTSVYAKGSEEERESAEKAENAGLSVNMTKEAYVEKVERVREYIRSGDVYQVNLTQRFSMKTPRSASDLYLELRKRNAAPFAAYLNFSVEEEPRHILSSSPERLLRLEGKNAESRPIKGTLPRGKSLEEDEALSRLLENSEKDRSELLMIVDLVRNDMGRVAKPGTVKVPQLFHVEHYATVHHLVASVVCEIEEGKTRVDLLESIFPGGSITGAPKIRAMEIIDELEPTRRTMYTGSLGYIGFDGDMDFNILIRSILKVGDQAYYQVGGGIVWDSNPLAEYDETLHKGKAILKTLTGF